MNDRALPRPLRREAAEARVNEAKRLMSSAARAFLDDHPDAVALSNEALIEMNAALHELADVDAEAGE